MITIIHTFYSKKTQKKHNKNQAPSKTKNKKPFKTQNIDKITKWRATDLKNHLFLINQLEK
ncbi:hypothetical protein EX909_22890 [Salmonella enterica subsp. enterica serovar Litchfield]|nr:hypothetical protein [Salmonella enterica subsp. enterica serovar Typhimurium]ECF0162549.1 hypothetical protein [Salmonella enterica subsp. enterica serovar Litchfield]